MQNNAATVLPVKTGRFERIDLATLTETEKERIVALAVDILNDRYRPGEPVLSPENMRTWLKVRMADYKNEVFGAIFLDQRYRIIATEELFHGTVNEASVYPRVVVQRALVHNAAAALVFHNHVSGVPEPSQADKRLTERLSKALSLIDVAVLDHLVVGATDVVSFASRGLI